MDVRVRWLATASATGLAASLAGVACVAGQGVWVRVRTPKLPAAGGPVEGATVGAGEPLSLLTLGESTVDGVGVAEHEHALTGQLASALADVSGRRVRWRVCGRAGADAAAVCEELVEPACARKADVVVIALGVNDTLKLRTAARYRRDLLRVVLGVRGRLGPVPILLAGVPPMGGFPRLPRPLRTLLRRRSGALDAAAAQLVAVPAVIHVPLPEAMLEPAAFAADGFHPGRTGYRIWGRQLAENAAPMLAGTPG